MAASVVPIDTLKQDAKFEKWYHQVMMHNTRTSPLSNNELVFLKNRFKEGKKPEDIVI